MNKEKWYLAEMRYKRWVRDHHAEESKMLESLKSMKAKDELPVFLDIFSPSVESESSNMIGYFLLKLRSDEFLPLIRKTYFFKKITPISDHDVENLKTTSQKMKEIPKKSLFYVGEKVEVTEGPQKGFYGNIKEIKDDNAIIVVNILESTINLEVKLNTLKKCE
jgi:transcription antitermination factor NusG